MRKCKHKCATHLGHTTPQAYQTSGCGGGAGAAQPQGVENHRQQTCHLICRGLPHRNMALLVKAFWVTIPSMVAPTYYAQVCTAQFAPEGTQLSLQQLSPNRALQLDPPNDTGTDKQSFGENPKKTHSIGPRKPNGPSLCFQGLGWKITENKQARRMFAHGMELLPVALTRTRQVQAFPACWAHGSAYNVAQAKNTKRPDSKPSNR